MVIPHQHDQTGSAGKSMLNGSSVKLCWKIHIEWMVFEQNTIHSIQTFQRNLFDIHLMIHLLECLIKLHVAQIGFCCKASSFLCDNKSKLETNYHRAGDEYLTGSVPKKENLLLVTFMWLLSALSKNPKKHCMTT